MAGVRSAMYFTMHPRASISKPGDFVWIGFGRSRYVRRYRTAVATNSLRDHFPMSHSLEQIEALRAAADHHLLRADLLHAAGEEAEAFDNLSRHAEIQEKIYAQERQRAVSEMQERFDLERAERERETFRLKSRHLETMMEQRSRELTSMAMHLVKKNTFLQKFRRETLRIARDHPEARAEVERILGAIERNLEEENDWQRFEREFQQVHHDFLRMISELYPQLSPAELKVCALLKINLSNKEITRLLSVSVRNVESHRYSIRKKLGLPSGINLATFLAGL
jgi:DNA-binding CsgD family transcriptional regulator